jgi:hypothetical protein
MDEKFYFFRTFYPKISSSSPIVVGYENISPKLVSQLKIYPGLQFLHSGNWWNLDAKERTPEKVMEKYVQAINKKTYGIMSINVQPKSGTYIWELPAHERNRANKLSMQHALEMAEIRKCKKIQTDLFCTFEIGTPEDALYWYQHATEIGFDCLGIGAGKHFSKGQLGKLKLFSILKQLEKLNFRRFHVSGCSSLNILILLAYFGVTSADGSTPIISAAGYGTIYDYYGNSFKGVAIKNINCSCPICKKWSKKDIIDNIELRILHNNYIWDKIVKEINSAICDNSLKEYIKKRFCNLSKYYQTLLKKINI